MRPLLLLFAPLLAVGACNGDKFDDDAGADTGGDGLVVGGDGAAADGQTADVITPKKRFCETIDAQFCADFDIPNDAGAGFGTLKETNGYTLSFENGQSKSAPVGVGAFIPGDAGGTADLNTVFFNPEGGATPTATLDLDMYVPNLSTQTTQPLFFFAFGAISPSYQFGLAHDGPVWKLEFLPAKSGPPLSTPFALNEWLHVTLVVFPLGANGYATLTITSSAGTSTASTIPGQYPTAPPNSTGPYPMMIDVGPNTGAPPLVSAQAYYDNVVVRVQ